MCLAIFVVFFFTGIWNIFCSTEITLHIYVPNNSEWGNEISIKSNFRRSLRFQASKEELSDLIHKGVGFSFGAYVRDVDDDAPRSNVDVHAQMEEFVQRPDNPRIVLLRVHFSRKPVLAARFQECRMRRLKKYIG